jgi:hypothetical protein
LKISDLAGSTLQAKNRFQKRFRRQWTFFQDYKTNFSSNTKLEVGIELTNGDLLLDSQEKIHRQFHFISDRRRTRPDPESEQ